MNTFKTTIDSINLEHGFFHVINDDGIVIQCCLMSRVDGNGSKKQIDASDCGYDDGLCGDVNAKAFEMFGQDDCYKLLMSLARKEGLSLV